MRPVETDDLTIHFEGRTCIHARRCVLGLPGVFKPGAKGGWIFPEGTDTEALVKVIEACPSGALSYTRKTGADEAAAQVNTVRLWENGPVALHGDLRMPDGSTRTRATLCRCGKSANKPYCDNSHIEAGFTATGEPARESAEGTDQGGPLEVKPITNGPLGLSGNLEIIAASGRQVKTGERAFLCRCGASKTKPFCDGSHKEIGFTTEAET